VRARPPHLGDAAVIEALAEGWHIRPEAWAYVPEGGGSHHWKVTDAEGAAYFVTVDDLDDRDWLGRTRDEVFEGAGRALRTAAALRDRARLRFVVAPLATRDGGVITRLDLRYAVSVYEFLAGRSFAFGPYPTPALRHAVLDMVIALHEATPTVEDIAPTPEAAVGHREDLDAFLRDPAQPWDTGPFSEGAHQLLGAHWAELAEVVAGFDHLVERTALAGDGLVVTHGEPHPANVMQVDNNVMLIDWDTVGLAPPERDLWLVVEEGTGDSDHYEASTGRRVDPAAMTLYRLRWYLDDIASAIRLLRHDHDRTADTEGWWEGLAPRIAALASWREALG
jgi:spectinomycin phosphotransferase